MSRQTKPRRGRPLDHTRDQLILAATADLLAARGYHAMSIDAVAAHAGVGKASIYRRWDGKRELVLETLRHARPPVESIPSIGSLRGDLRALFDAVETCLASGSMDHVRGVLVALRDDAALAALVRERLMTSWTRTTREIVDRAVARGEIHAADDEATDLVAYLASSLLALRILTDHERPSPCSPVRLVDHLLPILDARRLSPRSDDAKTAVT